MSLRGYVKKGKPALWTTLPSHVAQAVAASPAVKRLLHRNRIRPVSKRRQATSAAYRARAQQVVREARARGETCPVVAVVKELREGRKYGRPISAKLNEVHHTRGRAGRLLMDERFWLPVSKQGHRWVHDNMAKARALGFLCELGDWGRQP